MAQLGTYSRSSYVGEQVRRLAGYDNVFNVLTYGAVGDGVTDDFTAITNAISAAYSAGGGIVYFPEGTYAVNGLIEMQSGVTLQGVRRKSILKTVWLGATVVQFVRMTNGKSNMSFYDMSFDGNAAGISFQGTNIQAFNCTDITFRGCYFTNMLGITCLFSTGIKRARFVECDFLDCGITTGFGPSSTPGQNLGKQCIVLLGATIGDSTDNSVVNCTFNNIGLDSVAAEEQHRLVLANNRITKCGAGMYVHNSEFVSVVGNVSGADSSTTYGPQPNAVDCGDSNYVTIAGNTCYNMGGAGISVFGSNGVSVTGNTCINNNQTTTTVRGGIVVGSGSSNVVVAGNVCTDTQGTKTQQYGLVIDPTCTNVVVGIDNYFGGNLDGDISSTNYDVDQSIETPVTYVAPYTSTNGVVPGFEAKGAATDIDVQLKPKGAGAVDIANGALEMAGTAVINSSRHPVLRSYAKASLPSATVAAQFIYVTDDAGGATPAFSDGTNWRRVADRAVIS